MLEGAGDDGQRYRSGTMSLQAPGAFIGSGASGHHVIDQQQMSTTKIAETLESATHVFLAHLESQFGLRRRGPIANDKVAFDRNVHKLAQGFCNFGGLVETALAQPVSMQWHGNDGVAAFAGPDLGQPPTAPIGNGQAVSVLECMDDAINRKIVAIQGDTPFKEWRFAQTGPAALAMRRLIGANGASRSRQTWQIGKAVRTKQLV